MWGCQALANPTLPNLGTCCVRLQSAERQHRRRGGITQVRKWPWLLQVGSWHDLCTSYLWRRSTRTWLGSSHQNLHRPIRGGSQFQGTMGVTQVRKAPSRRFAQCICPWCWAALCSRLPWHHSWHVHELDSHRSSKGCHAWGSASDLQQGNDCPFREEQGIHPATSVRVRVVEYWPDGVRPDLLTDEGRGRKAKGFEGGSVTPNGYHWIGYGRSSSWRGASMGIQVHSATTVAAKIITRIIWEYFSVADR